MSRIVTVRALNLFLFVAATVIAVRADEQVSPRPKLLIIGASSLNSPLPQTQLVAAMLESQHQGMDVEGRFPDLNNVAEMLGTEQR